VGEGRHIMVLPTVGLVTLAANLMVGWLIMKTDHRTAWVLWGAAPIIQVFLIVAIVFLWSVNG